MYSGLLPKGLTEEDLSPDDEDEKWSSAGGNTGSPAEKQSTSTGSESATNSLPGGSQDVLQKFHELQKKKDEMKTMKIPRRRSRRRRQEKKAADSEEPAESRACREEQEKPWDGLKQYFGANDRFHPPACSKPPPKSGLEKSIEKAIAEGDIAKAEEMSDRLATREGLPAVFQTEKVPLQRV
ncbi:hypothetical protein PAMA_002709 [Pampus argenteus]